MGLPTGLVNVYTVLCQYAIELAIVHSSGELLRTQLLTLSTCAEGYSNHNVCLSVCLFVCHLQDLGDSIILTLKTSINAKQIIYSS